MTLLIPGVKEKNNVKAPIIQIAGSPFKLKIHSTELPPAVFATNAKVVYANTIKKTTPVLPSKKQQPLKEQQEDNNSGYTIALVNEELMHPYNTNTATTISTATNPQPDHVFVKIEEQVSGHEQKNTYYLQVENNHGTPVVKPLVILNESAEMSPAQPVIAADSARKKNNSKITL